MAGWGGGNVSEAEAEAFDFLAAFGGFGAEVAALETAAFFLFLPLIASLNCSSVQTSTPFDLASAILPPAPLPATKISVFPL